MMHEKQKNHEVQKDRLRIKNLTFDIIYIINTILMQIQNTSNCNHFLLLIILFSRFRFRLHATSDADFFSFSGISVAKMTLVGVPLLVPEWEDR